MGRSVALRRLLVVGFVLLTALPMTALQVQGQGAMERVIVVLRPNVANPGAVASEIAGAQGAAVGHVFSTALKGFSIRLPTAVVQRLAQDPRIALIDPDLPVVAAAQTVPTGVRRIGADQNSTAQIDGNDTRVDVDVAVLDTGVDAHPDLNVVGGTDCTGSGGYGDDNGHGTHVAGIIGALDNGFGVVGVAPGARIWSVKVLDSSGNGTWSNVICGIDWVAQHAGTIAVANLSLDGPGPVGSCGSNALHQAICNAVNAGVTFTAAAGNDGADAGGYVPGGFPEVIDVAALADSDGKPGGLGPATWAGPDDTLASFSNRGSAITVEAPGVDIYSTTTGGGYATMSGTSMAAAHAAGAAALYIAANGRVDPSSVKSALAASRDSAGVVNVADGWSGASAAPTATVTGTQPPRPTATATVPGPTATATTAPSEGTTGTAVTTANLNLRDAPSLSGNVLTVIPAGATVTLTGQQQNGFLPVSYQGTAGWSSADYLDVSQSGPSAPTPTPGSGTGTGTATTTDNLNLRGGPSTGDSVLTVIPAGATVTLTGQQQNGYLSVSYNGTDGWAYGDYLDQSGTPSNPTPSPSPTATQGSSPNDTGSATTTANLNLRTGPSTDDAVLDVIPDGATVSLTGQSQNGYISVSYGGTDGWAYGDYLVPSDGSQPAPTAPPSSTAPPTPDTGTAPNTATVTSNLNLRSGPGTSYDVIEVMPTGATVTITGGEQDGYYPVTYQGGDGWASADYLQVTASTSPPSGTTAATTANLNLRAGPSTGDAVLTVIPEGATVTLTGQRQNDYVSVSYQGTDGWAYSAYLE